MESSFVYYTMFQYFSMACYFRFTVFSHVILLFFHDFLLLFFVHATLNFILLYQVFRAFLCVILLRLVFPGDSSKQFASRERQAQEEQPQQQQTNPMRVIV